MELPPKRPRCDRCSPRAGLNCPARIKLSPILIFILLSALFLSSYHRHRNASQRHRRWLGRHRCCCTNRGVLCDKFADNAGEFARFWRQVRLYRLCAHFSTDMSCSYSDNCNTWRITGNVAKNNKEFPYPACPPAPTGRASGGKSWPEYVASTSPINVVNYAYSAATCSNKLFPRYAQQTNGSALIPVSSFAIYEMGLSTFLKIILIHFHAGG